MAIQFALLELRRPISNYKRIWVTDKLVIKLIRLLEVKTYTLKCKVSD